MKNSDLPKKCDVTTHDCAKNGATIKNTKDERKGTFLTSRAE